MPRYKPVDLQQDAFVPIRFDRQILPGSFEFALQHLLEHQVDLSAFDDHYQNEENGDCEFKSDIRQSRHAQKTQYIIQT